MACPGVFTLRSWPRTVTDKLRSRPSVSTGLRSETEPLRSHLCVLLTSFCVVSLVSQPRPV